jgi:hydroxybutyrate-dimer hydrolase
MGTLAAGATLTANPAAAGSAGVGLGDKPASILGAVTSTHYDGISNDLLTAGLGATGIGLGTAPSVSTPPTVEELRQLAIWTNYRALIDPTPGGGYGVLYGPNVTKEGIPTSGEGMIAGTEVIAQARSEDAAGWRHSNITFMLQIPDSYDISHGCLVAAPSSGSRGVYGAIATAGDWGLKHGCAVVFTDKGSGTGADDLHNNLVETVRGVQVDAATAGNASQFTARLSDAQRQAYDASYPNRFAFKHAHSQVNSEADWGADVLESIRFAFWAINQKFVPGGGAPYAINRGNTIVIASSVSNGGGASLRAVEQDRGGLIDGAAVGEPNVNPVHGPRFVIQQGSSTPVATHSRPLIDYITFENIYAGCAAAAYPVGLTYLNLASSPARCAALAANGLVTGTTLAQQAADAQNRMIVFGFLPEQNFVLPSHWFAYVQQSIAVTYANAYGRFSVTDNLCGYSFAATTGSVPAPLAAAAGQKLFGTSNGIPPTSGISLINNAANAEDRASTPDQDLAGALCLRGLATGRDTVSGDPLTSAADAQTWRIREGAQAILAKGDLHGVPAIWVAGRNDGILPPNFAGRAYYGLTQALNSRHATTRYYEVTNAQHLDAFNEYPGYANTLVPLHHYFLQAMDLMYAHLTQHTALPPSQVVHTIPRGGTLGTPAPAITLSNVPPINPSPSGTDMITFGNGTLFIPD